MVHCIEDFGFTLNDRSGQTPSPPFDVALVRDRDGQQFSGRGETAFAAKCQAAVFAGWAIMSAHGQDHEGSQ
jgi:hypothetical protein